MGVLPVEGGVAALHPEVPAGVGGHLHLVHWRRVSRGLLLLCYCLAALAVPTLLLTLAQLLLPTTQEIR